MGSAAVRKSSNSIWAWAAAVILLGGCTIERKYIGPEVRVEPEKVLVIGTTTKGEVLDLCGPPDEIREQFDGDIFVYRYARENYSEFKIEDFLFTGMALFTYSRRQNKKDNLVILFDENQVIKNFAIDRGTEELTTF